MSDPDDLPVKGNGQLTLAENTADNGGLRIAFRALMDALVAQKKTADDKIDGYTENQRVFLSFAQLWCENQTFFSARQSDPHSLGRVRVKGAVQNFEEFGKAFQCTKGQPMYQSQTGDLQLQKSCWRTGRTRGTDGVLLRTRGRILQRRRVSE